MQDLEDEIGVDLLKRSPRGVTITAEGKLFLEEAREVLKRADESVEKENPRFLIRVNDLSAFASQPRCPVNYNAEQPCTIEGLLYLPAACASTADAKSGFTPSCASMMLRRA